MHSDLALSRTQTSVSISISRAKPVCTCNSEAKLSLAASSADALFHYSRLALTRPSLPEMTGAMQGFVLRRCGRSKGSLLWQEQQIAGRHTGHGSVH